MKYNYLESMIEDIKDYIFDRHTTNEIRELLEIEREDWENTLNDALWCEDSVTGNGSGSYTFSTWKAEENLCHNLDLLQEALEEFGSDINYLSKGAEACDVTIRCYLLSRAISEAIDEIEKEMEQ